MPARLSPAAAVAWARTRAEIRYRLVTRLDRPMRWVVRSGTVLAVSADPALPLAGELDAASRALLLAFERLDRIRAWTPEQAKKHPRGPDGKFLRLADRIAAALVEHIQGDGKDNPLDEFNREQLRKVAKELGLPLQKGMDRDAIVKLLIDHADKTLKGPSPNPDVQAILDVDLQPALPSPAKATKKLPASAVKPGDQVVVEGKEFTVVEAIPGFLGSDEVSLTLVDSSGGNTYSYVGVPPDELLVVHAKPKPTIKAPKKTSSLPKAKEPTKTSVPGVTLTDWADIPDTVTALSSSPNGVSLEVELDDGEHVGDVHFGGSSGTWLASPPPDAPYGLSGGPGTGQNYPTKDQAIQALVDAHNQHAHTTPKPTKKSTPKKALKPQVTSKPASELKPGDHVVDPSSGKVWTVQAATPAVGGSAVSYSLKDGAGAVTTGIALKDEPITLAVPKKAAKPKSTPKPVFGHDVIGHIPEPLRKKIFGAYKAQPTGQLLSSPAHESYDNLVAIAHVYGSESPGGFLTPAQIAAIVDEQLAEAQHIQNTHLLENKIKKWLETANGSAYAVDHATEPNPEIVARLTGEVVLPEGVTLKPGQRVQTLSGPGKYKPGDTHFPTRTHDQVLGRQHSVDAGTTLTPGQVAALKNYTGGGYVGMNSYLRGDDAYAGPLTQQHVVDLQSAFVPWPEPMLLVRGTGWEQLPEGFRDETSVYKLVGKTLQEPGFVSTSPVRVPSAFEGAVKMVIEAPAGTPGRYVEEFSVNSTEYEHVLAAGTKFRVVSVTPSKEYPFKVEIRLRVVTPK